jgi:hypothetical protein
LDLKRGDIFLNNIFDKEKVKLSSNHKYIENKLYKQCSICAEWKESDSSNFYKNKASSVDELHPWCKPCTIKKSRNNQNQNKDRHSKSQMKYAKTPKGKETVLNESRKWRKNGGQRSYYQKNKDKHVNYRLRNNTLKKHDITDEEWFACLDYFKNSCAYCGLSEENQYKIFNQQLHREHVNHSGSNYIENCVPSCTKCNTSKHDIDFNNWYNEGNEVFSKRRLNKIINWMTKECFKVLNLN